MTNIICEMTDCIHNNHAEKEEDRRCKADAIGIEWRSGTLGFLEGVYAICDSYLATPKEIENKIK